MATTLKTPGVYIQEQSAFPNSVVGVETAIPAFVGYTEKANFKGESLLNMPVKVDSFKEFEQFFGKGAKTIYGLQEVDDPNTSPVDLHLGDKAYNLLQDTSTRFNLYDSMKFFYQNGGGTCFVVSVGTYGEGKISKDSLEEGIKKLEKETEPTMLLVPDAVLLDDSNCYALQQQMLAHCGRLKNRVAILDIYNGDQGLDNKNYDPIKNFRDNVSSDFLSYGAAYYPWLHTTVVEGTEINFTNLNTEGNKILKDACMGSLKEEQVTILGSYINFLIKDDSGADEIKKDTGVPKDDSGADKTKKDKDKDADSKNSSPKLNANTVNSVLSTAIPIYKLVMEAILKKKNLLPPSPAIAGIYTSVDNERGVWKAPANVAVSSVVAPSVLIDNKQQEGLNAPILGKAICAIRPFIGLGVMIWGARTLDANSLDWRYINVRRTMIMLEQSIKFAAKAYVFEPNVKNTWVSIQAMISNFLTNIWKQGGLAGAAPADAFQVNVGLGTTMTATDILEGIMKIEVKVAVSRPAEFIVISFEQQMQKS